MQHGHATTSVGGAAVVTTCVISQPGSLSVVAGLALQGGAGLGAPRLLWGVAASGQGAWHEPPEGWATRPSRSSDAGKGAWQTELLPGPPPAHAANGDGWTVRLRCSALAPPVRGG